MAIPDAVKRSEIACVTVVMLVSIMVALVMLEGVSEGDWDRDRDSGACQKERT